MRLSFDKVKNTANMDKHGVALDLAVELEWDTAASWLDNRKLYNEARYCAIGYIGLRLYFVAFVDRADTRRIISLRRANKREEKRYAST